MAADTSTAPGAWSSHAATKRWRPSQRIARKPPPLAAMAASAITRMATRFSGLAAIVPPHVLPGAEQAAGQPADHDVPVAADQPFAGEGRGDRNAPGAEIALAAEQDGRDRDE